MVTTDVDVELRAQLKEAGKLLSVPRPSLENLLHVLDQLEKLLSLVDQSPNHLMQEALSQPIKVLVDESLLEHSNVDVKVTVASCLCEITRITAPDAPYNDGELKRIFRCIVSSFENLSDRSSRSYSKRVSILETVSKVRTSVIMLDLDCDDLIVKMFEHFLNSVWDDHLDNIFSYMSNIMVVLLEESEEVSLDILKLLLASVKNNREGVLPVARKLGEEVIKRSADKLRPYLKKTVTLMGDSLVDYSQVLTYICEGRTNFVQHKDESASVQQKVVGTPKAIVPSNDADKVNISNEKTLIGPGGAVDHPGSSLTGKLVTNNPVAENSTNVESNHDAKTKPAEPLVSETVHGEDRVGKNREIVVSVPKPLEAEVANAPAQSGSQQERPKNKIQIKIVTQSKPSERQAVNAPSQSGCQQDESQSGIGIKSKPEGEVRNTPSQSGGQQDESQSEIGIKSKPESEVKNTPSQTGGQQEDSQSENQIKKGIQSKKMGSGQTDRPSTVIVLTNASKGTSDPEIKSQKRVRKKTAKAEENNPSVSSDSDDETLEKSTKKLDKVKSGIKKTAEADDNQPSVTSGSDVELLKESTKKLDTVDSESKKKSLDDDDTAVRDDLVKAPVSDSGMTSLKRARKKTPKAESYKPAKAENNPSVSSVSDDETLEKSTKKLDKVNSGRRKTAEAEDNQPSVTSGSDVEPLKESTKKPDTVDSESKKNSLDNDDTTVQDVLVKAPASDSGMTSLKRARKKTPKADSYKPAKAEENNPSVSSGSDVEPLKQSTKKLDKVSSGRKKTAEAEENKLSVTSGSYVEPLIESTKKLDTVDSASKKKSLDDDDTDVQDVLVKAPVSDSGMTSLKRVRKKTPKADSKAEENKPSVSSGSDDEMAKKSTKKLDKVTSGRKKTAEAKDNKPSVTSGSDVEPLKESTKKLDTVDSESKKKSLNDDDTAVRNVLVKAPESDSGMTSPKRIRKKTPKAEGYKLSATGGSDAEPLKKSTKKAATIDSGSAPVKRLGKKAAVADPVEDKPSVTIGSDVEPVDSGPKLAQRSGKKIGGGSSVAKKPKLSGKKAPKSKNAEQDDKEEVEAQSSEVRPAKASLVSDTKTPKPSGKTGQKSKIIPKPSEDLDDEETESDSEPLKRPEKKKEESDSDNTPLKTPEKKKEESDSDKETDSDNTPLSLTAKKGKKSGSSLVKSSVKNNDGKKQGRGKDAEEKDQTKSLSDDDDDDGMDVPLKSVLKKASKKKVNSEGDLSTSSKRKRHVTQKKEKVTIMYDYSLVGKKVKVWWPHDEKYYEGVIDAFYPQVKKHKVLYRDGDEEVLDLQNEKWEILKKYSAVNKDAAVEVQITNVLPERGGSSKGKSKVGSKGDENEETKNDDRKEEPAKLVYSRVKKGSKRKTVALDDDVGKSGAGETGAKPKSQKDGSKSGNKRKRVAESEAADAVGEPERQKGKSREAGAKKKKVN